MLSKKRRRREERPTIHPRNKYSENPPDFRLLASLYPSFEPFVFYTRDGRPRIDWTDFNATRELTRVLLDHDHGVKWWIPDGQLCPAVPNRSNYIHWIEDLLSSDAIERIKTGKDRVRGFDIGTGANCIYPILGASLLGWSFVGSDVTDVALEWAEKNVKNNPHISEFIEIRKAATTADIILKEDTTNSGMYPNEDRSSSGGNIGEDTEPLTSIPQDVLSNVNMVYKGPPVLLGVVKDGENFDFCMCNPPFFESMEEAGQNPKTSCGGTIEEMVCPGGEKAFITRIIEDSVALKQSFRWYTSMVGKKSNMKVLVSKLREVEVTIVKTTEFVQGQTCRWGLAWSFVPPIRKLLLSHVTEKSNASFMLEGLQRQFSAMHILQYVQCFFLSSGASSEINASSFVVDIKASNDHCNAILEGFPDCYTTFYGTNGVHSSVDELYIRVSVFQQFPGSLLVRGSLQKIVNPLSGAFPLIFQKLEETLKKEFCREKVSMDLKNQNRAT